MKKFIFVTVLLLLCFGVIVQAEPLPLVPGVTSGTQAAPATQKQNEEKKTPETSSTTKQTEKDPENSTQAISENKDGDDPVKALDERLNTWFNASSKDESYIDKIAFAVEGAGGDYRNKTISAVQHMGKTLTAVGEFSAESYRAACDALFGWDYSFAGK